MELLLKTEYDLPADQMVGCFSITGFANARLHFMTFVDFGFACGYATIFRLFIQQGVGILVGIPFTLLPLTPGPAHPIQLSHPFNSFS